jgi:hypothetical protein
MFGRSRLKPINILKNKYNNTTVKSQYNYEVTLHMCVSQNLFSYSFRLIEFGTIACIPPESLKTILTVFLSNTDGLWEK